MQKTIYISDSAMNKSIMERVEKLMKQYGVSFSTIVVQGLKEVVSIKRPGVEKGDFRNAKVGHLR